MKLIKIFKKGFTLVELVIVIAVVAILTAVLIPTFSGIIEKAQKSAILQEAVQEFKASYTEDMSDGKLDGQPAIEGSGYYIEIGPKGESVALYNKVFKNKYRVIYDGEEWSIIGANEGIPGGNGPASGSELDAAEKIFVLELNNQDEYVILGLQDGVKESQIRDLVIPESIDGKNVVQINGSAFYEEAAIKSVTIPKTIREIGEGAFIGCRGLTTIVINENNPNFKQIRGVVYNGDYTEIHFYAYGKTATELNVPDTVVTIRPKAFSGSLNLQKIVIPSSVKNIEDNAFENCVYVTELSLSEGLEKIGSRAFNGCIRLENLTLPASLTLVGDIPFEACQSLKTLTVTHIGKGTAINSVWTLFSNNENDKHFPKDLRTLIIADGATEIGEAAAYMWDTLERVIFPSTLEVIGKDAFYDCDSLTTLEFAYGVKEIKYSAFKECDSLTSVILPASVTTLGQQAFGSCDNLESIVIPASVTSIDKHVFTLIMDLKNIYYGGTQDQWNAFGVYKGDATVEYNYNIG